MNGNEMRANLRGLQSQSATECVRVNGLERLEPQQIAFGTRVVLAGDRHTSVLMRVAGADESVPVSPIAVRPAYRPEPRPRLSVTLKPSFESRLTTIAYRAFIAICLGFVACGIIVNAYVHSSGAVQ